MDVGGEVPVSFEAKDLFQPGTLERLKLLAWLY